ncbi:MAG: hypothetical protein Q8K55_06840 [Gemmatimonadaceae bacterium]|nr:hypothetical protein [Gemmatimonadaceae bacterium]
MTLQSWLDARVPEAPEALRRRIAELVAAHPEWEAMPRQHALLSASELLMKDVLAAAPKDRDAAIDLLAGDACVTYAFEAAADEPGELDSLADQAMQRIAKLADL